MVIDGQEGMKMDEVLLRGCIQEHMLTVLQGAAKAKSGISSWFGGK